MSIAEHNEHMEVSSLPRLGGRVAARPSPRWLARLSDERLVEHLRRGHEAAFEVMYDRHHRGILSFCRHMLASREEAEDAVQHTFISAYRDLADSDKEIRLKAWLYTIARNRCLSMLRARREQAELTDIPTAGLSDSVLEREDLRQLLGDIRGLPEDQRAALVLSELGDLSHAEIATTVGCDPMKVKSLVFQARSSLMEDQRAREIPCQEIREQLSTLRGGALRRGPMKRHLRSCPGCTEFRDEVNRQRKMVALLLPVVPSIGLKQRCLRRRERGRRRWWWRVPHDARSGRRREGRDRGGCRGRWDRGSPADRRTQQLRHARGCGLQGRRLRR
jgi:RNA polymerase sigma factor (sigma-70 family)